MKLVLVCAVPASRTVNPHTTAQHAVTTPAASSANGGICDCGNLSAWKLQGCCSKHRGPESALPAAEVMRPFISEQDIELYVLPVLFAVQQALGSALSPPYNKPAKTFDIVAAVPSATPAVPHGHWSAQILARSKALEKQTVILAYTTEMLQGLMEAFDITYQDVDAAESTPTSPKVPKTADAAAKKTSGTKSSTSSKTTAKASLAGTRTYISGQQRHILYAADLGLDEDFASALPAAVAAVPGEPTDAQTLLFKAQKLSSRAASSVVADAPVVEASVAAQDVSVEAVSDGVPADAAAAGDAAYAAAAAAGGGGAASSPSETVQAQSSPVEAVVNAGDVNINLYALPAKYPTIAPADARLYAIYLHDDNIHNYDEVIKTLTHGSVGLSTSEAMELAVQIDTKGYGLVTVNHNKVEALSQYGYLCSKGLIVSVYEFSSKDRFPLFAWDPSLGTAAATSKKQLVRIPIKSHFIYMLLLSTQHLHSPLTTLTNTYKLTINTRTGASHRIRAARRHRRSP